jgi:hypothetical protein
VRLGYSKSAVKDAPRPEVEGELTRDEERRLFDHYGSTKAAAEPTPEPEAAPEPSAPGPERPFAETQTVVPEPPAPQPVVPEPPAPEPEPVSPLSAAPEPTEPEAVPTAVEPESEREPVPTPAPTPALAERRDAPLERFSEGWLIDGTLVQPRRARLRRYVITEELILEADGTESSRIVGKEPYPDPPQDD